MAEFFNFLQKNRPEIGLVDRYDLSEIYDSDERFALTNLLLNPDGLDQIYKLSQVLAKEDIRTMGDLDRSVVHSLAISEWTLSSVSYNLSQQISTDKAIGEPGKHSFTTNESSDNIILFHGGIAAEKIEYNFLDEFGSLRTTAVPTSRESLFNSSKNEQGQYTSASYPSLFRIRRRSHIYDLRLASKLLLEKGTIIESPTDTLKIPVYMQTTSNTSPGVTNLQCYATKNSPIALRVRFSGTRTITFERKGANSSSPAFVYGWEIRRRSNMELVASRIVDSAGARNTVNITINLSGTRGNGVDCILYVYLDPSAIVKANLSGIGLVEDAGKDIGLIGFNNLEELNISGNGLSTMPVWVKVLHEKLRVLDIRGNSFWNNGIVSWFDWQEPPTGITGASDGGGTPNVTLSQVMGYSGWTNSGQIAAYDGSFKTVQDSSGRLYKNQRNIAINGGTPISFDIANGFRPFTALKELYIGSAIRLANPDFFYLFPNLETLQISRDASNSPEVFHGLIPRLKNNGAKMTVNLYGQGGLVGGSIRYLGSTATWNNSASSSVKAQFIGQFKLTYFNINNASGSGWFGGICTANDDVGLPSETVDGLRKYSFVPAADQTATAWDGWLTDMQYLYVGYRDIALRLALGSNLNWKSLIYVDANYAGAWSTSNKVQYNASVADGTEIASDVLTAGKLGAIDAYYSGWYGKIFSIRSAKALYGMNIGANNLSGYKSSDGREYFLPSNFADENHPLEYIYAHYLFNSYDRNLEFRPDDLKNLPKLKLLYLEGSYFTGKFPTIYTNSSTSNVQLVTYFGSGRFRDLSSIGSSQSSRVSLIYGPSNGTGVGGSLLPNFRSLSTNNVLYYINLNSTLSSLYPSNWVNASDRGKPIASLISGTTEENTPSVTWTSRNNNNTANAQSEKLYQSNSGGFTINSQVLVGDRVFNSQNVEIGRVTQIDRNNEFIFIDSAVSISAETLKFRRTGQNISDYFDNHTELREVYIEDAKITGSVPQFKNCTKLRYLYLSSNLLTTYQTGTLKNIVGMGNSTPALLRFGLERNPLTKESVKAIIGEVHDIAEYYRSRNVTPRFIVQLYNTRYNSANNAYQNWTKSEIFDQSRTYVNAAGETVTEPDPLETKFNQLGTGNKHSNISIQLF